LTPLPIYTFPNILELALWYPTNPGHNNDLIVTFVFDESVYIDQLPIGKSFLIGSKKSKLNRASSLAIYSFFSYVLGA